MAAVSRLIIEMVLVLVLLHVPLVGSMCRLPSKISRKNLEFVLIFFIIIANSPGNYYEFIQGKQFDF